MHSMRQMTELCAQCRETNLTESCEALYDSNMVVCCVLSPLALLKYLQHPPTCGLLQAVGGLDKYVTGVRNIV